MKITVKPKSIFLKLHAKVGEEIYLNDLFQLHREDGPAITTTKFKLYRENGYIKKRTVQSEEWWLNGKKIFAVDNYGPFIPSNLSLKEQEFIIKQRPHLTNQIPNLKKPLQEKYQHELNLGKVDL
jgi:hypothetical protein